LKYRSPKFSQNEKFNSLIVAKKTQATPKKCIFLNLRGGGEEKEQEKPINFPKLQSQENSFLMAKKKGKKQEEFSFPD